MAVWAQRIDKHIEKHTTMAKVTYLDNCGFAVKTDNILLQRRCGSNNLKG